MINDNNETKGGVCRWIWILCLCCCRLNVMQNVMLNVSYDG